VVDLGFSGNMGKRMKRANKLAAVAAIILGDDELARGEAALKLLDSGEQLNVKLGDLATTLAPYR
jgi:histidyl-tRNA synthetase